MSDKGALAPGAAEVRVERRVDHCAASASSSASDRLSAVERAQAAGATPSTSQASAGSDSSSGATARRTSKERWQWRGAEGGDGWGWRLLRWRGGRRAPLASKQQGASDPHASCDAGAAAAAGAAGGDARAGAGAGAGAEATYGDETGSRKRSSSFPFSLLSEEDVPEYLRRAFITTGYWVPHEALTGWKRYKSALRSLFRMHNETLNAWSMIALATVAAMCYAHARHTVLVGASTDDHLAFALMCFAPILHCPFALGNHLFPGVSERAKFLWRNLDVSAQILMLCPCQSAALGQYALRRCSESVYRGFMALLSVYCLWEFRVTIVRFWSERIPVWRLTRTAAAMTVAPLALVWIASAGREREETYFAASMTLLAALAALVFANRFPEKKGVRGRWDLVASSHQLMHVGLILVFVVEYHYMAHLAGEDNLARLKAGLSKSVYGAHQCWPLRWLESVGQEPVAHDAAPVTALFASNHQINT